MGRYWIGFASMTERAHILDERKTCRVCGHSFRCPTVQQNRFTCAACERAPFPFIDDNPGAA